MAKAPKPEQRIALNEMAISKMSAIAKRWLPNGELRGHHWVAPNPRSESVPSSDLKVDLRSGRWRDWTTNDHGEDPVSLAMFLTNMSEKAVLSAMTSMLEVEDV